MTQAELRATVTAVLNGTLSRDDALELVQSSLDAEARTSTVALLVSYAAMLEGVSALFALKPGAAILGELATMLRRVASAIDAGGEIITELLAADSPEYPIAQAQQVLLELAGLVALTDLPERGVIISAIAELLTLTAASEGQWRRGVIIPFVLWISQPDIAPLATLRQAENALWQATP